VTGAGSFVRTVLGDVPPATLGFTTCHEHLLTSPAPAFRGGDDDLLLDDPVAAAVELGRFALAGGRTVVEVSTEEFGRDTYGLASLAARTGVAIVAATGHVCEAQWAGVVDVEARDEDALTDEMVRDLVAGVPGAGGVRAGVIKVGTSAGGATQVEARVLRAAARAQAATGAPIVTHTTAGTAGVTQARLLIEAGAAPAHVLIGHQDLRLDGAAHREILSTGCAIAFDSCGKERHAPDAERVAHLRSLIDDGHGHRVCLGGDMARRSDWTSFGGGPGLTHLPWRMLPWLMQAGVAPADARRLVVDNPAALLAWRTRPTPEETP
jgi:phosphotriesterase-related protein